MEIKMKEGLTFDDVLLIPKKGIVNSRSEIITKTQITKNVQLIIPLISLCMDTVTETEMAIAMAKKGGLGIIHRFMPIEEQCEMVRKVKEVEGGEDSAIDKNGKLIVSAAVGIKGDYLERGKALVESGCDVLVIDVAHAHSELCINALKNLKKETSAEIIVGNVATAEGFEDLVKAGADAVKVGIGNGTICITRIVAGAGVPQITAIQDCYEAAKKYNIPLISCGGTKNSGDIVKAISAGSSAVMIGSQFAGTDEAPGEIINLNGKKYKSYRGSTCQESMDDRKKRDSKSDKSNSVPEGVNGYIHYKGSVNKVIDDLTFGIKSGLSYCGVRELKEAIGLQNFIKMTSNGLRESFPHDLDLIKN